MSDIETAIAMAVAAHAGQKDKVGQPYILHPLRVMFRLQRPVDQIVGVLHDVVEDTHGKPEPVTFDTLRRAGFSEEVVAAIEGVTKRRDAAGEEEYEPFIERAAQNPVSRRVKIADLEDNMDVRRLPRLTAKDQDRLARYVAAWHRLQQVG